MLTASNPSSDPAFTYSWSFVPGLSSTTIANPVFTPTTAGTYELTVTGTNSAGCTRTVSVTIAVVDVRCGIIFKTNKLIEICYNGRSTCVAAASVPAHLARGASIGKCQGSANSSLVAEEPVAPTELSITATPNPTSANASLDFTLTESGSYRLEVMNMQGALISVVAEGSGEAGESFSHQFSKGRLAAGVYMVRLTSGKQSKFTRLVLQD
jgi:PKD repeat protein